MQKKIIFIFVFSLQLSAWHADLISLQELCTLDSNIIEQHCFVEIPFKYKKLPFDRYHYLHPKQKKFLSSYIVTMFQGKVFGYDGSIIFNKKLVADFVWQNCFIQKNVWDEILNETILKLDNSVIEQIAFFKEADIIIGSLGSGMSNIIFCKPDVKLFDIFQKRCDCTIYYMAQTLGLEYYPIKTMDFIDTNDGQYDATVPLEALSQILQYL